MGLPFKNGAELAQALGYGEMYQAAQRNEDEMNNSEVVEGIKRLMRKINEIRHRNIPDTID